MRRRKATRGRPRKVKKGRHGKVKNNNTFDSKLSGDNLDDQATSLKSDDAVVTGFIGLDKTGPYSYRVGSVNIELEGADEDIKPVIQENDIMLEVSCGSNTASMFLSKLCQGSKGSCIEFDGAWLTPNEFQFVSGRETAKDWKRSIRHFGRSLKLLINKGILTVHPAACRCDSCRLLSATTTEPKLVLEKREMNEKMKNGSEGSTSGSEKDGRGSDEDEAEAVSEGNGDSQDETENGEDESGSDEGDEEMEEGKVEENNNEAGDKESSSSSDGSSSSGSSSDSDSDSEEEKKDEEEEAEEEKESMECESKPDVIQNDMAAPTEVPVAVAEAAAVVAPDDDSNLAENVEEDGTEECMEVDESAEKDEEELDDGILDDQTEISESVENNNSEDEDADESESLKVSDEPLVNGVDNDCDNVEPGDDTIQACIPDHIEALDSIQDSIQDSLQDSIQDSIQDSLQDSLQPPPELPDDQEEPEASKTDIDIPDSEIPNDVVTEASPPQESIFEDNSIDDVKDESVEEAVQETKVYENIVCQDNTSSDSTTNNTDAAADDMKSEQSPVQRNAPTPLMVDNPFKKSVERSNSGSGKSRLSNIIDLLRTTKEKETQKQPVPEKREEERQERRVPEVKEIKTPSPLPAKREEVKPKRLEKEETKPTRDDVRLAEAQMNDKAMWFPMGRLPFGFPPPDLLERASREAHEQLSKSHRQFEKNLESLIAQNMNPFIPELSIYSLPEQRAQMEYTYLKNMERLDQMAKERMATMAELRHQQLLREHNKYVAKLAEQQTKLAEQHSKIAEQQRSRRQENERPRDQTKRQSSAPTPKRKEDGSQSKVPPAHRAMPEVRKDKPDQRTMQTPPAAHHHQPASRPPSTGSKPPSSLPLPASSSRAAHPSGPSATQSRSSPMIAPIAPPLQMWSSCFPNVIPPPTMEMQRLTQFFPNLNGGLFTAVPSASRQTESPILDLSTKKRKMQSDSRDHESRSKEPRLSTSAKSVRSSPQANGLPRDSPLQRSHSNKDSSKERSLWPGLDRNSALTCTCALQHLNDIRTWSVDDVCCFMKGLEGCTLHVESFRRNGIDGQTLLLLNADTLMNSLGMKPGAAKFLTESVSKRARDLQKLVPCEYCRMKIQKG